MKSWPPVLVAPLMKPGVSPIIPSDYIVVKLEAYVTRRNLAFEALIDPFEVKLI